MRNFRELLKRFLPPPVKSFMREVKNIIKEITVSKNELREQIDKLSKENYYIKTSLEKYNDELKHLYSLFDSINRETLRIFFENKKEHEQLNNEKDQLILHYKDVINQYNKAIVTVEDNYRNLERLILDNKNQFEIDKKLINDKIHEQTAELNVIKENTELTKRSAFESVWAEIFKSTVNDCHWLKDVSLSPGRWAVGYPYLYVMYRVLNEFHPKSILEFGLGQSTSIINSYIQNYNDTSCIIIEQDISWIELYKNSNNLHKNCSIKHVQVKEITFLDDCNCLVYDGLLEHLNNKRFDFISIDGPAHSRSNRYRRIDVINLIPEYLCDSFVMVFDDINVPMCKTALELIKDKLRNSNIDFVLGMYHGEKDVAVICSKDCSFFATL